MSNLIERMDAAQVDARLANMPKVADVLGKAMGEIELLRTEIRKLKADVKLAVRAKRS